ncbi:nucleoside hydrolase [Arenicella chitinivorans]|uniref:Nucleoside hydrolase n=1 Tax=Arenicella chitinivorans TaxID=1329800 RepID=A0A918VHF8_9GAMM|nr:nucleoside hydrolase [Arenicella chitinivorans]GGZ96984.1 nucleoside hydrolase [Arenicella chitinivorans]
MPKIILDTDPGIDDAQAIAFAIAHPDIELLGLTTVFGNAEIEITTRNALHILDVFGQPQVPVAQGASDPLHQTRYPAPDFVHGTDGLGNIHITQPSSAPVSESAAEFIVRMASENPGEITLVAIGPLTNIAHAVSLDPSLPAKVKSLVVMGGSVAHPGNVTPLAEANFFNDPHAADAVFAHDWPATIIGLDVTLQTVLRDQDLAMIRDAAGRAGKFLWDTSRFYIDFYASRLARLGSTDRSCAMHDASALVYTVLPDAFQLIAGPTRVINDGIAAGQLSVDTQQEPYVLPAWTDRPLTSAAIGVDAPRVLDTFLSAITNHSFN